ncbi:UPF0691 protein C9orf116-like isoform X2 [Orbicella faveolata]|uniref:UPF0691 protein C9orf116-like isoform X2 n=1 Tax=Orbicella faveolata TaxID=48498 RepID=UPI0009E503E4|nr:UPF0691 protein C9orf116-like isoform X2 [Orbicella faveolata]
MRTYCKTHCFCDIVIATDSHSPVLHVAASPLDHLYVQTMESRTENLEQMKDSPKGHPGAGDAEYDFEQTKAGKGAVTSHYYRTFNIPERFDNPDWFEGYNTKKQNPMYMTSSMEYGRHRPTVHTMPTSFHAKSQTFTEKLGKCGMFKNQSLNTAMDKSIV